MNSPQKLITFALTLLTTLLGFAADTIDDVRVGPLVQSHWDQLFAGGNVAWGEDCYNYYTPLNRHCGCVATALAQVIRYHEWPKTAVAANTYECQLYLEGASNTNWNGLVETNLTMKGGVYDWSKMPFTTERTGNDSEELEMIGRLCYDVGVSMSSRYVNGMTAAAAYSAIHTLPNNFKYANSEAIFWTLSANQTSYDETEFKKMIVPSLDAGCPCVLTIYGTQGGHTVVCDGYGFADGQFMIHINGGYSGPGDGWYPPTDMKYIGGYAYTSINGINFNISPTNTGSIASGRVLDQSGNPVSQALVTVKINTTTHKTMYTNEKGIYFFWGDPGTYDVTAQKDSIEASTQITLYKTYSVDCNQDGTYYMPYVSTCVGNSAWNDLTLTGYTAPESNQQDDNQTTEHATQFYPLSVSLAFSMTADNKMMVSYEVSSNGVASTWDDTEYTFTESETDRNLWRGNGNQNIGSAYLVRNFSTGGWSGYPVINSNLEAGGSVCFWEIDVPFDLKGNYSITNVLPKAFITNSSGDSTGTGQPTKNNKQYDINIFYLTADKSATNATVEVRTDKLGAALVNTASTEFTTILSNGILRIRMDNSSMPNNGAFGGIQGIDFSGVITETTDVDDDDPSGDEPGGSGDPASDDPVEDDPTGDDPVLVLGTNIVVKPLTQAMWNQGRHYNRMCPVTDVTTCADGRMWAGCTAVATAILMKYYEWPREGETFYQNLNDEKSWANDYTSISLRARFYRPYEWAKMQDIYGNVTSADASLAVGELLSDIGAVMNMNYGTDGSSTLRDNVPGVLEHNFHFDASEMYQVNNSEFTPEVEKMIQAQLREGHPIVSAGAAGSSGTGHTYVCDGYAQVLNANGTTNNLYHFNFGWGGTSNGWYPLSAVFTSAKPGETAVERPVESMLLGVYPQKAPQIHSAPDVTGTDVTLDWSVSPCWTNKITGFRLERQDAVKVPVNLDLTHQWNVRSTGWGWSIENGIPVAKAAYSWAGSYWPTMGVSANTTNGISVSSATTITIKYKARQFPNGVTLSLIKSTVDGDEVDSSNKDFPTLATLTGGSSTSAMEEKTVTVSGSVLSNAFGLDPAYFALRFTDPNSDTTFYNSTEVFRLVSFTVTGEGEGWATQATQTIAADKRTFTWSGQPTGKHNYVLTSILPSKEASSSVVKTILATKPTLPTITLSSVANNKLTFTVANTSSYSYTFETQSNIMRGTGAQSGNTVTWTFANDLTTVGTHWVALTVTDSTTGASGRYVYISNPPTDHPLCPYTERSLDEAVARAKRESKLVLLVQTGDPDATKFMALSGILGSNDVVTAIAQKYVVAECVTCVPDQYALGQSYWRGQPQVGHGNGLTSYQPSITAYPIVINPEYPSVPYACDTLPSYYMSSSSRWNYFNSQYDIGNLGYSYYVSSETRNLVTFLSQSKFVVTFVPGTLEPTLSDATTMGTIAKNDEDEYVVTPKDAITAITIENAGENTIVVPPGVATVVGVEAAHLKVKHGSHDISAAFNTTGDAKGLTLVLGAGNSVIVGGETITVRPVLAVKEGDDLVGSVPFVVTSGAATMGVKSIPGLKYTLLRGTTPGAITENCGTVTADGVRVRLQDKERPTGGAFYRVQVEP